MDLFFACHHEKQHVYLDVSQTAKGSALQDMLRELLELDERPTLMRPKQAVSDFEAPIDWTAVEWEPLDAEKPLKDYGYEKEVTVAHKPAHLAFLLPGETEPKIDQLSQPKPIPEDLKGDEPEASGEGASTSA